MNALTPGAPAASRRYFERAETDRTSVPVRKPVCLYLETTNRCQPALHHLPAHL